MDDSAQASSRAAPMLARDIRFELGPEVPRHFCPSQPELSHAVTAFMAALPHLEPYFIHNIREVARSTEDSKLRHDIEIFVGQEARHAQQHRALNTLMARYYPELPRLERDIKARLDRSRRHHSLAYRMAYTAGYETITYHLVGFIMEQRNVWLADADPGVLALLCWHGAEEVEHKSVAFDAYQAAHGGYLLRIVGLLAALVMTVRDIDVMLRYMLKTDGLWGQRACRRRLRRFRLALLRGFVPRLFGYFRPRYHPSRYEDPATLVHWLERYAAGHDLRRMEPQALDELLAER